MITESMIYWITRLDYLREAFVIGVLLSPITAGVLFFAGWLDNYGREQYACRCKRTLFCCLPVFLISVVGLLFVPTTAEMAMIKVIPIITNSKFVAEELPSDARKVYELGKQRLIRELAGEKK